MGKAKQVVQISYYNDRVIKVWDSVSLACRELGIKHSNLISACKGDYHSAGGYRWRYKESLTKLAK